MSKKYTKIHLHTDLSNGTTNIDSVTKFQQYIDRAKEEGMDAIAFTEHGNIFSWVKKKEEVEKAGLKYIHAVEMYVTKTTDEKIRDNYHTCLYARNWDGVLELNKLLSRAYNREDGHFYYTPRITFDELIHTSNNIIVGTACIGGILARNDEELKHQFLNFIIENKHRCFLEIQHHQDISQINHNKYLLSLSKKHHLNLIVGTDTHALNETHAKGRRMLQKAKGIHFTEEDGWDITWKTYDELMELYRQQGIFKKYEVEEALENTNRLADMIEEFTLDRGHKYPKLYDDGLSELKQKINDGILKKRINKYPNYRSEYIPRINRELKAYQHNKAIDYLLLDEDIKAYGRSIDAHPGPSRGSVSGSIIAYLIGMTEMDSIKHKLNFERFMNSERVSLADVDTDWSSDDREKIKHYIYNKPGLYCADIITFNTVALKGSIRDVCRALYKGQVPQELLVQYDEECHHYGKPTDETSRLVKEYRDNKYLEISNYICENIETRESQMRREYPEVFEYVDIINGTVVSIGTHPCGTVVSPIPLDRNMGLLTVSTSENPVTMIPKNEVEGLFYVKLDLLGLDNVGIINETCKLASIERLNPDNVPDDEKVWEDIRLNTIGIFQWESDMAGKYLEQLFCEETLRRIREFNPDFKYIDLFSVGNGALRPAGASYRDLLAAGIFRDNGHEALNKFLAPTLGYLVYQEQIIEFLHSFCGFTMGEADTVRRSFAKKTGTEIYMPKIKAGFIKTMEDKYNVHQEEAERLIINFLQVITDASDYLFSLNHSQAYSYIGYICGYLRYYYPLEFLTAMLNTNNDNKEKTIKIMEYAKEKGINIEPPTFGKSKSNYFFDKGTNTIYKGIQSIKFLNGDIADYLYNLYHTRKFSSFVELLSCIEGLNSRQLDVLIKIGYFREFGLVRNLLNIANVYQKFSSKKQFKKGTEYDYAIKMFSSNETEKTFRNVDTVGLVNYLTQTISQDELPISELAKYEAEFIGTISITDSKADRRDCIVLDIDLKYTPTLQLYKLQTGEIIEVKVKKDTYYEKPLKKYDAIYVANCEKKPRRKKIDDKWVITDEYYLYINYYKNCNI